MISSLQTDILFGLPGVYLILGFQFRSYIQPLTVMLAIPTGIVVNDSILLVAFIKQRLREGMGAVAAAQTAAKERFRAIILTSLTTIAGMTPLLLETSTQAQFLIPLVASLAFGLLSATLLSLFLVPAVCVVFDDLGLLRLEAGREKRAAT